LNQPLGTIKPQVDNLRNFLLTPTAETLSFFQQLQEHLVR
jgi:hypothetical protein